MTEHEGPDQGRKVDQNVGLGQQRVDEPNPGTDQIAEPGSAGGPGNRQGRRARPVTGIATGVSPARRPRFRRRCRPSRSDNSPIAKNWMGHAAAHGPW